jgi:hypothetical protein
MIDIDGTIEHIANRLEQSSMTDRVWDDPYSHAYFTHIFPEEVYVKIQQYMPSRDLYNNNETAKEATKRNKKGKKIGFSRKNFRLLKTEDGPSNIKKLRSEQAEFWNDLTTILTSDTIRIALMESVEADLLTRFDVDTVDDIDSFPGFLELTRDEVGYKISPHTDRQYRAVTVQFYLPEGDQYKELGTNINYREDKKWKVARKFQFMPNSGYAFAVSKDKSWHSANVPEGFDGVRNSLLYTINVKTKENWGAGYGSYSKQGKREWNRYLSKLDKRV